MVLASYQKKEILSSGSLKRLFYIFVFTWCLTYWVFIRTVEITPDAPLPWAEQSQLAQPLLIGGMLQTLHHCLGPTLDSFQMSLQGED